MKNAHLDVKNVLLTAILTLIAIVAFTQPCLQKCVNDGGGFSAQNLATGALFTVPQHTIVWNQGTFQNAFTGQGTNTITWASISSVAGNFTGSYTVTNVVSGCDTTITFCVDVILPTPPTLDLTDICFSNATGVPIGVGVPAGGVYTDGLGNVITQITPSMVGQTITYTTAGANGCSGSVTDVVIGLPLPNGGILGF
jgi:hypothetical protein